MTDEATTSADQTAPVIAKERSTGLRAGRALAIGFAYLLVQVAVGTVIGIAAIGYYMVSHGGRPPRAAAEALAPIIMLPAAMASVAVGGAIILLLTALALRKTEQRLADIGWRRASSRDIWMGVISGVLLASAYVLVQWQLWPPPTDQKWGPLATAAAAGGWQRGAWACIALLAPPVEEFLFRGVLWTGLRRSFGAAAAATVVTVAFVGSHATEALTYWPAWLAIAGTAVGTLALRIRTGSLVPPVALHAAYNASLVVMVYASAV